MEVTLKQIAEKLKQAKKVAIFTHMRPDGDALGSSLSLSTALTYLGIQNEVCVETDIPSNLTFMKGLQLVKKTPSLDFDTLITVDSSDVERLGQLQNAFLLAKKKVATINVDHHISNTRFAQYNYVRECSSNCLNIAKLIQYLGVTFDKKIAEYLYIGLLTDSGNFSHDDVNEETFLLASQLAKQGVDVRYYHYNLFKKQSKARAKLHAKVMDGMRYFHNDRFAVIIITAKAMQECEADNGMTEGFVDFPLSVEGVEVACSIMEVKPNQYKISLRSKEYADVNKIAGVYGGGGHVKAAGCMLFGDVEEVIDKLSYTVSQYLE